MARVSAQQPAASPGRSADGTSAQPLFIISTKTRDGWVSAVMQIPLAVQSQGGLATLTSGRCHRNEERESAVIIYHGPAVQRAEWKDVYLCHDDTERRRIAAARPP